MGRARIEDHRLRLEDGRTIGSATWGDPNGTPVFIGHGTPGSRLALSPGLDDPQWIRQQRLLFVGPDASDMLPEDELADLWYEVMHLDAPKEYIVPIIKNPCKDGLTGEEWSELYNSNHRPRSNVIWSPGIPRKLLLEALFTGNGWPMILIKPNYRHGSGHAQELIRFKFVKNLEDNDLFFMSRFYEMASRNRPKVYRVPKNMEGDAITHKAIDSLARA